MRELRQMHMAAFQDNPGKFSTFIAAILMLLGGAVIVGTAIAAQPPRESSATYIFDIPAQKLNDALQALALTSKHKLLCSAELVDGKMAPALKGEYTAEQAVKILLKGTELTYEFADDGLMLIRETSPRAVARTTSRLQPDEGKLTRLSQNEPDTSFKDGDQSASAQNDRTSDQNKIQEIVVTAQKREERLKNVPISISVLGGDDLDRSRAQGVTEALNSVPGVVAQESYIGGGTQVAIRGVAPASTLLHGSSPIAYYLDSVPFGLIKTAIAPDSNAYDLERVEVLRGPQGTLYGASALNGVVRVLTKDADLNEVEFKARTSASSTDRGGANLRGDMAVSVPLIAGKLGARAVLGYEDLSGWIDRPNQKNANDAQLRNLRLKLNAQPTDELSIGLSAWSSRNDYGAPSMANDEGEYTFAGDESMYTDYDAYGLKVDYDFSRLTVTGMTAYLDFANSGALDLAPLGIPGVPFVNSHFAHVFSQEINLNSAQDGVWRWSIGGIYRDAKDRTFQSIEGIFPADVNFSDTSESFAAYGEVTRTLLDGHLELTGGLRYFEDRVGTHEIVSFTGVTNTPLVDVSSNFQKTTPRLVLTWLPSDQLTVYTSYAEGFRSGFQQQPNVILTSPQIPPVDADSLKNYELGARASAWNGRLTFDTALYYIDWQDVQSDNAVLINNIPVAALANGGSASGVGFDFSVTTEPVDGLELGANFSWNDLTWDEDVFAGPIPLFAEGDRLSLSPEYTVGASVDYSFPMGAKGYKGRFSTSARYTSEQYLIISTGSGQGDSILIARASFSVDAPSRWAATIYADNLNNEDGAIEQAPFGIPDWTVRPRPRTLGIQLEYRF